MVNSADPDQLASSEANWSGSTLFAKAEYIRVQQDKEAPTDVLLTVPRQFLFVCLFKCRFCDIQLHLVLAVSWVADVIT